jgi:hypothetical protein
MAAKITYKPSYAGTGALMNGPEMQEMLRQKAVKGMEYAIGIAPERTGDYKEHFSVEVRDHGGVHGDRAEAKIVNDSDHATEVEWRDGYHVLSRTAGQLGSL